MTFGCQSGGASKGSVAIVLGSLIWGLKGIVKKKAENYKMKNTYIHTHS